MQYRKKSKAGGEKEKEAANGEVEDPAMVQTRGRMARIDAFLNTIPAQYFLGFDHPVIKEERQNCDPAKAKSTAKLLMEAAEWDVKGQTEAVEEGAPKRANKKTASGKKRKICQGKRRKLKGGAQAREQRRQGDSTSEVATRKELHERLERKLAELREKRREKQSEADKAKAAQRRALREAATKAGVDWRQSNEEIQKALEAKASQAQSIAAKKARLEVGSADTQDAPEAKRAKVSQVPAREEVRAPTKEPARAARRQPQKVTENDNADDNEGGPEVGRIIFEPKPADLPFGAGIKPAGEKMRRMRSELRKQEQEAERLRRAADRGHGEELRSHLAMQKALLRVQGHKVRDDSRKLRQAQKALEMRKKKGREKREQQQEDVRKEQAERQMRRKENLKQRSANKKKNRRSGFEGMRDGFMNSEVPAVAK